MLRPMTARAQVEIQRQSRRSPAELRVLLLAAARLEFATKGFANTTNRDVAVRAGVAISVFYRHFESKADLFSDAVLEPFLTAFEKLGDDWMRQLDEPLADEDLMRVFLQDIYGTLSVNRHAVEALMVAREQLPDAMTERIRFAFDRLITQVRVMTELEARRRGWMSTQNIDMSVRVLIGMAMGMSSNSWLLFPGLDATGDDVIEGMTKVGLWGMTRLGEPSTGAAGSGPVEHG